MQPASRVPLSVAVRRTVGNVVSRFPRESHQPDRLDGIALPKLAPTFTISPGEKVFTIGSCFARNIEEHLAAAGFDVPTLRFRVPDGEWQGVRPNGILNKYTPAAIRIELELAIDEVGAGDPCLVETADGSVIDVQLAANVPVARQRGSERRREVRETFGQAFDADVVVITLGQTETWWDAETGMHLNLFPPASIHRHHTDRFFFESLTYEQCLADVQTSITLLLGLGSARRILLSVSPVPLGRTFGGGDALTAYVASKSLLRAVAETVTARHPEVDYLPTFEAMMLSERSLVFEPNLHVRDTAVGEVVAAVLDAYMSPTPAVAATVAS